jgi:hypothetical protein
MSCTAAMILDRQRNGDRKIALVHYRSSLHRGNRNMCSMIKVARAAKRTSSQTIQARREYFFLGGNSLRHSSGNPANFSPPGRYRNQFYLICWQ